LGKGEGGDLGWSEILRKRVDDGAQAYEDGGLGIGLGIGRGGGRDIGCGIGRWGRRVGFWGEGFGGLRLRLGRNQDERGRRLEGGTLGFEQTRLVEVAMEGAVVGVHAALEVAQLATGLGVGLADGGVIIGVGAGVGAGGEFGDDDCDFGTAKAAAEKLAVDQVVDHGALLGSAGLMVVVVFGAEGGAFGGIFPREDFGRGVNAGFQGIPGGAGLALDGAWTVRLLGVETIRPDLLEGCHKEKETSSRLVS
jgi:hypothetical protein